jgi:flagellar hook protein FlgE
LVLASFASSDGLQPASGTVFTETFASGAAVLGSGTTGSFGSIRSSNLEQSNIDMAAELVNLMIQQRNYQANSQGISAANTVMTTAINMGR